MVGSMIQIFSNENAMIVHGVKNLLELNEIDCFLKNEHASTSGANLGLGNLAIELWIHDASLKDRALALIEETKTQVSNAEPWICEKCKQDNEGNFDLCWNCQSSRPNLP